MASIFPLSHLPYCIKGCVNKYKLMWKRNVKGKKKCAVGRLAQVCGMQGLLHCPCGWCLFWLWFWFSPGDQNKDLTFSWRWERWDHRAGRTLKMIKSIFKGKRKTEHQGGSQSDEIKICSTYTHTCYIHMYIKSKLTISTYLNIHHILYTMYIS